MTAHAGGANRKITDLQKVLRFSISALDFTLNNTQRAVDILMEERDREDAGGHNEAITAIVYAETHAKSLRKVLKDVLTQDDGVDL